MCGGDLDLFSYVRYILFLCGGSVFILVDCSSRVQTKTRVQLRIMRVIHVSVCSLQNSSPMTTGSDFLISLTYSYYFQLVDFGYIICLLTLESKPLLSLSPSSSPYQSSSSYHHDVEARHRQTGYQHNNTKLQTTK